MSIWSSSLFCSGSYTMLWTTLPHTFQTSLNEWSCCSLCTSCHRPSNILVDGWNHNNCNSASWAFWKVYVVFSQFASVHHLLSLSCQIPLSHIGCLWVLIGLYVSHLFLPKLGFVYLWHFYFLLLWWAPLLFLLAFHCHSICVWITLILFLYLFLLLCMHLYPTYNICMCL